MAVEIITGKNKPPGINTLLTSSTNYYQYHGFYVKELVESWVNEHTHSGKNLRMSIKYSYHEYIDGESPTGEE